MTIAFKKLFLDTSAFIYLLEDHPLYASKITNMFEYSQRTKAALATSSITFMEFCVKPYEQNKPEVIEKFKELLIDLDISVYTINVDIADGAAELRGRYKLKPMDALQLAACRYAGCDKMVTNDKNLLKIKEVDFLMIEDWESQKVD
jgi:predicted nucleic acid-binding protein